MDDFYAARSRIIPPLPWSTFSPPFSLIAAAVIENAPLLLLVMPFCGFFYGAAFVGALALVNASVEPERRATYVARFYTVGYLSNALPTLALGLLSDVMGLELTFHLFSLVLIALAVLGALLASGYRRRMVVRPT